MTHLGFKLHESCVEIVEYFIISGLDWKVKIINIFKQTQILFINLYLNQIYYIPDACHNMKLARNALDTYRKFKSDNGIIDWAFIQDLNKGISKDNYIVFINK